jgi:hypothetical protein
LLLTFLTLLSNDGRDDAMSAEFRELHVADAGIFGGGISCLDFVSSFSEFALPATLCDALEELLFQLRLSLRRSELVDAGVLGSSELDVLVDGFATWTTCGTILGLCACAKSSAPGVKAVVYAITSTGVEATGVVDSGPKSWSFGSELDANGDAAFLGPAVGIGMGVPRSNCDSWSPLGRTG